MSIAFENPTSPSPNRPLGRNDVKTLVLAALGGALEFYDFIIYVFFAAVIAQLFFPKDMPEWLATLQTYGIFAAGYLARPLGGVIMAHFGDRVGRKRMFTLSVFLMAVPTLAIGLLPTYASAGMLAPLALLVLRVLQGAAIGGEIPGAWVFVAEHAPARRVGLACGALTAGLTAGILLGSLIATAINRHYTPDELRDHGWRLPFLIGGVFGFFAVFLRRWLEETPVFEELRRRKALAQELPLKLVLREHRRGWIALTLVNWVLFVAMIILFRGYLGGGIMSILAIWVVTAAIVMVILKRSQPGAVVLSMLATWMLTAAIVVVILMTPVLLQKLHGFAPAQTLVANSLATLCLTLGCIGVGALVDRFGTGRVLVVGCAGLLGAVYALYLGVAADASLLLPLYALAGLCVAIVAAVPTLMVRSFPAPVRFTGISFSYNLAYAVFGGFTPPLVAALVKLDPLGPAHYVAALCVLGIGIGLYVAPRRGAPAGL